MEFQSRSERASMRERPSQNDGTPKQRLSMNKALSVSRSSSDIATMMRRRNECVQSERKNSFSKSPMNRLSGKISPLGRNLTHLGDLVDFDDSEDDVRLTYWEMLREPLDPEVGSRIAWDFWIVLLVLYNAFLIPIESFIPNFDGGNTKLLVLDIVIDSFFVADIVISFRTAFKDANGDMIRDFGEIRKNYIKGSFSIDLLATLPLFVTLVELADQLGREDGPSTEDGATSLLGLVSLLKCIRLFRLSRLIKFLQRFKVGNALKLMQLFMFFLLAAHWMGCIAVLFSTLTENETVSKRNEEWSVEDCEQVGGGWFCPFIDQHWSVQYVTALYFMTTTLTTVGFGDFSPENPKERAFFVIVMVIGSILYATILGFITSIITSMNKLEGQYLDKMDIINGYMREHSLPPELQLQIRGYYDFMWVRHKTFNMNENVLMELPENLSLKVLDHTHRHVMDRSVVFRELNKTFQRAMARILQPIIESPNEFIYLHGDSCEAIYFVRHGEVHLQLDGQILSIRHQGGYFGDEGFWGKSDQESESSEVNCVDAYTPKYCDMYIATRDDLMLVLGEFPSCKTVLSMVAEQRYNSFVKRKHVNDDNLLHKIVPRALSKAGRNSSIDKASPSSARKKSFDENSGSKQAERKRSRQFLNGFPGIGSTDIGNSNPQGNKYNSLHGLECFSNIVSNVANTEDTRMASEMMNLLTTQTKLLESMQKTMADQNEEISKLKDHIAQISKKAE